MIFLILLSCDDTIFGAGADTASVAVENPDYAADVEPIWLDRCDGCHTGGGMSGGLVLDQGADLLVGVPSSEAPDVLLVAPGDLGASWLWLKLAGEQTTGSAMPQGSPLSAGDLGTIQNWIEEGAP